MRRLAIPISVAIAALFGAGLAHGELTQHGEVRLVFDAAFSPQHLPRNKAAPVEVRLRGAVGSADSQRPPQLRKISIAINRNAHVSTKGLPSCEASELQQTTSKTAMERCGDALVGHGHFRAEVELQNVPQVHFTGKMLAFNSRIGDHPGLLLHIYGSQPTQVTFVLRFKISRSHDPTFGTVFTTRVPKIASELGYVTNVDLTFGRRYMYHGKERGFLSAQCAAPQGFPGAVFTFARGSFTFSDGQRLSEALSRNCWVL